MFRIFKGFSYVTTNSLCRRIWVEKIMVAQPQVDMFY